MLVAHARRVASEVELRYPSQPGRLGFERVAHRVPRSISERLRELAGALEDAHYLSRSRWSQRFADQDACAEMFDKLRKEFSYAFESDSEEAEVARRTRRQIDQEHPRPKDNRMALASALSNYAKLALEHSSGNFAQIVVSEGRARLPREPRAGRPSSERSRKLTLDEAAGSRACAPSGYGEVIGFERPVDDGRRWLGGPLGAACGPPNRVAVTWRGSRPCRGGRS